MRKRYYNAESLRLTLDAFEEAYEMSTEEFLDAHVQDNEAAIGAVPNHSRSQWSMFARMQERMCGGSLAAQVTRGLQVA